MAATHPHQCDVYAETGDCRHLDPVLNDMLDDRG